MSNILIYGFEKLNFTIPSSQNNSKPAHTFHFSELSESLNIDKFDGVIIPQGAFEGIRYSTSSGGYTFTTVESERDLLLDKERQIYNLLKKDKWICFLVQSIVDTVPDGIKRKDIRSTDVCKCILNTFSVNRRNIKGVTPLKPVFDEFKDYVENYGVAHTVFIKDRSHKGPQLKKLIGYSDLVVGFEMINKVFVLPYHSTDTSEDALMQLSAIITKAIHEYRQKNKVIIPEWLSKFSFDKEITVLKEIESYRKKINEMESDLIEFENYRAILTTSGQILKEKVTYILEYFWGFKIDPLDEGREDAKILNENDEVLALVEIKGTNRGIKREYINQTDSHRERNELSEKIPAILFINNNMSTDGLEKRFSITFPREQIIHSKKLNILVIRTIDLLYFIKQYEHLEVKQRQKIFLEYLNSGGG